MVRRFRFDRLNHLMQWDQRHVIRVFELVLMMFKGHYSRRYQITFRTLPLVGSLSVIGPLRFTYQPITEQHYHSTSDLVVASRRRSTTEAWSRDQGICVIAMSHSRKD